MRVGSAHGIGFVMRRLGLRERGADLSCFRSGE
jgi:hypothetical protein